MYLTSNLMLFFGLAVILLVVQGLAANVNNFTKTTDKSVCLHVREKGDFTCGTKGGLRFYYDKSTKHCQPFIYAGCNGNDNRFVTAAQCKDLCTDVPDSVDGSSQSGQSFVIPVSKCKSGVRAAINLQSQQLDCKNCPNGYKCENNNCCPTKEYTCLLKYDTGKYATLGSHTPRYFYNKDVNNCLLFTFYGALGNANNFDTYNECMKFCSNKKKEKKQE